MSKRNEHLIVIMLEAVDFNVEFEVWAQHITIVPWFPVKDEKLLNKLLQTIANRHKKFEVSAGRIEEWGRKQKYEVVTIDDNKELLKKLHDDVFESLEQNGFSVHQKDFLGEKYAPHIAVRNQIQKHQPELLSGKTIKISEFSLVSQVRLKKSGRMIKRLKKNYELKG